MLEHYSISAESVGSWRKASVNTKTLNFENPKVDRAMAKKDSSLTKAQKAVITYFDQRYGQNESRLVAWKQLCSDVGVAEGTSINQCKKVDPLLLSA